MEVISKRVISGYSLAGQWLGLYDLKKRGGRERVSSGTVAYQARLQVVPHEDWWRG